MRNLIFILSLAFLLSCSYFSRRENLLTNHEWILEYRDHYYLDDSSSNNEYYRESDSIIYLKFNRDHSVIYHGHLKTSSSWYWKNNSKDTIIVDGEDFRGEFIVGLLDEEEMILIFKSLPNILKDHYRHPGYSGWRDEHTIDSLNRLLYK